MIFIFVTCFSFILFFTYSLPIKPLPASAFEMRLLSFYFWKDFSVIFPFSKLFKSTLFDIFSSKTTKPHFLITTKKMVTEEEQESGMSVLDLPHLALECVLGKLEPDGLCKMSCVSTYLRDLCLSDHLWEPHMNKKWGRIGASAAYKQWEWHISSTKESNYFRGGCNGGSTGFFIAYFSRLWPLMLLRSTFKYNDDYGHDNKMKPSIDSIVSCYRALETGNVWFPAQVFNRENGYVGFMLSCYDADLSYDSHTDTFQARYPPNGRRAAAIETGVSWDRLRAPPIDISPHDLYNLGCLNDLRPRDHIEIQWRRKKQFPYGWWYGVVGHLEACDGNEIFCLCHESDTVVLEFNQYAPGSRWRQTMISRRDHREEGNEADGFYGGIRKLNSKDEIAIWRQFWPAAILGL